MPDDLWDDRWDRGGDASAGERPQIQMELLWLTHCSPPAVLLPVPVCGPGVGDPFLRALPSLFSLTSRTDTHSREILGGRQRLFNELWGTFGTSSRGVGKGRAQEVRFG